MNYRRQRQTILSSKTSTCGALILSSVCNGFTVNTASRRTLVSPLQIYAPPGSGYMGRNPKKDNTDPNSPYALTAEEVDQICPPAYPDTYEPMLEYPGTMRPGKTPENMPYHDLPGLDITDPDPVPWPHFQEIEWHHHWDPPEDAFPLMEDFIEMEGRWASVEDEAEMRMGMRRGVRERREMEESAGDNTMVIMDDDDEDDSTMGDIPSMMGLGDGVKSLIGSPQDTKKTSSKAELDEVDDDEEDDDDESFLFDLGLGDDDEGEDIAPPKKGKTQVKASAADKDDDEDDADDVDMSMDDDDDIDLSFDLGRYHTRDLVTLERHILLNGALTHIFTFDLGFDLDDDDEIDLEGDEDGEEGDDDLFDDFDVGK